MKDELKKKRKGQIMKKRRDEKKYDRKKEMRERWEGQKNCKERKKKGRERRNEINCYNMGSLECVCNTEF